MIVEIYKGKVIEKGISANYNGIESVVYTCVYSLGNSRMSSNVETIKNWIDNFEPAEDKNFKQFHEKYGRL